MKRKLVRSERAEAMAKESHVLPNASKAKKETSPQPKSKSQVRRVVKGKK